MPNYIKISRSDFQGHHIVDIHGLMVVMYDEFDDLAYDEPGTTVTLEVVEMTEEQFAALPEFEGW